MRVYCTRNKDLEIGVLEKPVTPEEFAQTLDTALNNAASKIAALISEEGVFPCWGASAKASTLLNILDLSDSITYCVDNTPRKEGLWIPGTDVRIRPDFLPDDNTPVLLTAWNFEDEFVKQYPGKEYITPYD